MRKRTQAGAALLMAMLTVALVATFAAATLWQQWRSVEVETAERARVQSGWIITGALDWARLLLREDLRAGSGVDHLGEPWAVPLEEARLSSFLAADQGVSTDLGPGVMDAFLSGQILDLQGRLNISTLADAQNTAALDAFQRLFQNLGLSQAELSQLVQNLRTAAAATNVSPAAPQAPLLPQTVEQLVWLGVSPETAAALQPHVLVMNSLTQTKVNLNTASAEVIAAAADVGIGQAQQAVNQRQSAHFKSVQDAQRVLGTLQPQAANLLGVNSQYFEVRSRLRLDQLIVEDRAVLQRISVRDVRILQRERVIVNPNTTASMRR